MVRSGGSLGPVDLVCVRDGEVMFVQVKRNVKGYIYLSRDVPERVQGFPLVFVADFGRGNIRVVPKKSGVTSRDGKLLWEFLRTRGARSLHCVQ